MPLVALPFALLAACTALKDDAPPPDPGDAGVAVDATGLVDARIDADAADTSGDADASIEPDACAACTGATPTCVPPSAADSATSCACTATSCGDRAECNPVSGTCETCPALPSDATDFYVDIASTWPDQPTGSAHCAFRTITRALVAARASTASEKTIHVADGTYSAAIGETFPLELRDGISLVGAGRGRTVIEGADLVPSANHKPDYWQPFVGTVVTGDVTLVTTLAGVTLRPGELSRFTRLHGPNAADPNEVDAIFVNQGNTPLGNSDAPLPPPTTRIRDVEIASGYDVGVRLVEFGRGPNVSILGSTFHGIPSHGAKWQVGVFIAGIGCGSWFGLEPDIDIPASASIGDGTAAGANTFIDYQGDDAAHVVWAHGCTDRLAVDGNVMTQSSTVKAGAVALRAQVIPGHNTRRASIVFDRNTVDGLAGGTVIDSMGSTVRLRGNTFSNIHLRPDAAAAAAAIDVSSAVFGGYPASITAAGNTLLGNDIGLRIGPASLGADSVVDFGTATAHGENVFRCNSTAQGAAYPGGDVWLTDASGAPPLSLAGNSWDHASPTTQSTASNGIDIFSGSVRLPDSVVWAPATVATVACPNGATP